MIHKQGSVTRERISRILELREILLSIQTGFNLVLSQVNLKGLHQGWTQTSFYLKIIHFTKSLHHKSLKTFFFLAYLHSAGIQHGNLHPARWPILFCGPTQEHHYPQLTQEKLGRGFGKNAGEWTGRVEISEEEIPDSKRSMHGNILTYSRL